MSQALADLPWGEPAPIDPAFLSRLATAVGAQADLRLALEAFGTAMATALDALRTGNLDRVETICGELLQAVPRHPHALHLRGVVALQRQDTGAAIDLLRRSIQVRATPEAWVNLGTALRAARELEQSAEAFQRAIALKPDMVLAHEHLASSLIEAGRYEAAMSYCRSALAIDPNGVQSNIQMAVALRRAGRAAESGEYWTAALAGAPNRGETWHMLGLQYGEMGQWPEALRCHDRAVKVGPREPLFHCARGVALTFLTQIVAASEAFRTALTLDPGSLEALSGLGWTSRMLGQFAESDRWFGQIRDVDPADARAWRHLAADGDRAGNEAEAPLLAMLERPESNADDRITAAFGLGRIYDRAGRYEEAFAHYAAGNGLVRANWPDTGTKFDAATFARRVDALIAGLPDRSSLENARFGNMSELPVFVVGMPRSGTTLVEQILASHSRVHGAGELSDIERFDHALAQSAGRDGPAPLVDGEQGRPSDEALAARLADSHVVALHELGRGALRVVDKMPDNLLRVGLIARMFPRARFVYCARDPRDIALSCYFQVFSAGTQHFSYDLADCGDRARDAARLAAHFAELLPHRFLRIDYERLVDDLEGESRRLTDFLDLEWEPGCLAFHRTERPVATVSHWQVRQPLYRDSVGRWRHYRNHLGPLFGALAEAADPEACG